MIFKHLIWYKIGKKIPGRFKLVFCSSQAGYFTELWLYQQFNKKFKLPSCGVVS